MVHKISELQNHTPYFNPQKQLFEIKTCGLTPRLALPLHTFKFSSEFISRPVDMMDTCPL